MKTKRVFDLLLADVPEIENARMSIAISVEIDHVATVPRLMDLQNRALHEAVSLLREHTRRMDDILESS